MASLGLAHTRETRENPSPARDEPPPRVLAPTTTPATNNSHNRHYYWAAFFLRISANCFSRFALALSCSSMSRYFLGSG